MGKKISQFLNARKLMVRNNAFPTKYRVLTETPT